MVSSKACVPSDLYPYVYQFLTSNGLDKAAKYFKKETSLDNVTPAGPNLVDIFNSYFQTLQNEGSKKKTSDDDPHDKDSQNQNNNNEVKKKKKKRKLESQPEENESENKKAKIENTPEEKIEEYEKVTKKEKSKKKDKKKKKEKKAEEKADIEEENNKGTPAVEEKKEEIVIDNEVVEETISNKEQMKNAPFRRVISESVIVANNLRDNSFEGKIGARGDWGEKANLDLKHTKGKSFRHEKTKKKRGSYKGGSINTSVNSIKFDNSDSD